jgi:ATP-binding cassette subfamily B protein
MNSPPAQKPMATLLQPIRGRLAVVMGLQALAAALVLSPLVTSSIIARRLIQNPADPGIWPVLTAGLLLLGLGLLLDSVQ